jgi:putative ABC transport system permease protein
MTQQPHARSFGTEEIFGVALETFRRYKVRFTLTALGVTIGTASVILVVTIGLTGKEYILNQIQGIGANLIYAVYDAGGNNTPVQQDLLTLDDIRALQQQVHGVVAASPLALLHERIPIGRGKEQDVRILGVDPQYRQIRNLDVRAGRFIDELDAQTHAKVAALAENLAKRLFGSPEAAVGKTLRIGDLPFTVIGTFKERVETFGQSELTDDTIIMPYPVLRYFKAANPGVAIFLSMADPSQVAPATERTKAILQSRIGQNQCTGWRI